MSCNITSRRKCGGVWCAAYNCSNASLKKKPGLSFFAFPKHELRCNKWVINCRLQSLEGRSADDLHKNCRLCAEHFEDCMFMNTASKNRLRHDAVPTLFAVPNPPRPVSVQRRQIQRHCSSIHTRESQNINICENTTVCSTPSPPTSELMDHSYCGPTSLEPAGCINPFQLLDHDNFSAEYEVCTEDSQQTSSLSATASDCPRLPPFPSQSDSQLRWPYTGSTNTPRKRRYRQIINRLRVQVHRAKKTQTVFGAKVKRTTSARIKFIIEQAREFLPDLTLNFFKSQMKAFACDRSENFRWSEKDKLIALAIYFHGLKSYRFMSRLFHLPSVRSLRRWMRNITVHPGISKDIMQILTKKFSNMNEIGKLCVLSFDEMSLKTALRYDMVTDCFIGLEDYGNGCRGKGLANQALVVMVRGLASKWKQAVGFCLAAGGTKSAMLEHIVTEAIDLITKAGGCVKLIVCDQGANNRSLFSRLGATVERPYFDHKCGKIFCMFDPPHLFKSIRNNLLKYVFQIGEDGPYVDWCYIRQFYNFDSKQPLRLCPKLTIRHMEVTSFSKMKVSYAVQVLSKSVAAGINTYVSLKAMPDSASPTAKFLERMDCLIDCFNSRSQYSSKLQPHKSAIASNSIHVNFLQNALQWVDKWKPIGARSKPPCMHGLKLTISALLHLWKNLNTFHNIKFLMTSRLNQDCLENLFSVIRQAGGCRDSPNAEQFGQAFRQCVIKSLLVVPKTANCVVDEDVLLASMADLSKAQTDPSPTELLDMTCETDELSAQKPLHIVPEQVHDNMAQSLSHSDAADDNIVTYISGYLIKKICETHECSEINCSVANLESDSHMFELQSQTFMYHKTKLTEKGDFGGLKSPSKTLVAFVTEMENLFRKEINGVCQHSGIFKRIKNKLDAEINNDELPVCSVAVNHMKQIFLVMRLHASSKFFSRDLQLQSCGRKNRKASKVMHV